ncbi:MAG: M48 family metallopeptidase [Rhodobacteraceae bacterium]|nr:M48 family metallopeptidase [Paracoccaceae bacterium]
MSEYFLSGDPPVSISVRRSARARRFSLRVSRLDGTVTLSVPRRAPLSEAVGFAEEKAEWIRKVRAGFPQPVPVGLGTVLPFEGRNLPVTAGRVRSAVVTDEAFLVPGDPARVAAQVAAYCKIAARQRLQSACEGYAAALGRPFKAITLRDTRSRWGSCTPDGKLMFSWRLVMAPPDVLAYVAAHEVAHLAEMNHSPAFWAVVARLMPDHARHRQWLKRNGSALHRFQFGA